MKLQPYHFQTPERPTEDFYQTVGRSMYLRALAEWESLYGEEPKFDYGSGSLEECVEAASIHQRWKDHQVRYKGLRKISDQIFDLNKKELINGVNRNISPIAKVNFNKLGSFHLEIWSNLTKIWMPLYRGETPSTDLFELILKENGIEL